MTRSALSLLAAAGLSACASGGAPPRCTTPAAAPSRPPEAPTVADDPLRARLPVDTLAAIRLDLGALMGSAAMQLVWPLAIWRAELDAVRAACGEQPWEHARELTLAYGPFEEGAEPAGLAVLAAGPVAVPEGAACAAALLALGSLPSRRAAAPDGPRYVVTGSPGAAARAEAVVQGGAASMRESAPFAGMSPSLRDARSSLLVDLAGLRARYPAAFRSRELPLAELSPQLTTARSLRVELADDGADRSLVRWTTHFADGAAAQASLDAQRAINARGLPALVRDALEHEVADQPHREEMLAAVSRAYTRFVESTAQPRVVGADLVYETRFDAFTAAAITGALAAVAVPAFTRYVKRAKTAEAVTNVRAIARAVVAHWDAQPRARRRLLAAIPRTPPLTPSAERVQDPPGTWDAVPWRALHFSVDGPHYYVYDLQSDGRTTFTARAQGDLDGDGALSTFSITGHVAPDGTITLDPLHIEDELE